MRNSESFDAYGLLSMDNFTSIPLKINTLDTYVHRRAILSALQESLPFFTGTLLDYGCGMGGLYGYIKEQGINVKYTGMDINPNFSGPHSGLEPRCHFPVMAVS